MTARNLHYVPCPVCQLDTLHNCMKCTDCGHQQLTQTQQQKIALTAAEKSNPEQANAWKREIAKGLNYNVHRYAVRRVKALKV